MVRDYKESAEQLSRALSEACDHVKALQVERDRLKKEIGLLDKMHNALQADFKVLQEERDRLLQEKAELREALQEALTWIEAPYFGTDVHAAKQRLLEVLEKARPVP